MHQYASTVVIANSARSAVGLKSASTVVCALHARSAVGLESASTVVGAIIARSAGGHQYASTVVIALNARSAVVHQSVSTVVSALHARSAVGVQSASTVVGAIIARSAVGHKYASTVVSAISARSAVGHKSASTVVSALSARSAVGQRLCCHWPTCDKKKVPPPTRHKLKPILVLAAARVRLALPFVPPRRSGRAPVLILRLLFHLLRSNLFHLAAAAVLVAVLLLRILRLDPHGEITHLGVVLRELRLDPPLLRPRLRDLRASPLFILDGRVHDVTRRLRLLPARVARRRAAAALSAAEHPVSPRRLRGRRAFLPVHHDLHLGFLPRRRRPGAAAPARIFEVETYSAAFWSTTPPGSYRRGLCYAGSRPTSTRHESSRTSSGSSRRGTRGSRRELRRSKSRETRETTRPSRRALCRWL